jgi:hypothetical protein
MKLLCHACNTVMDFEESKEGKDKGSLDIAFKCPHCGYRVSMVTNAGETQVVSTFGVQFGGRKNEATPLELTKSSLLKEASIEKDEKKTAAELQWSDDALDRIERVPPFVRPMAKKAIERFARERGYTEITLSVMDEAKGVVGH